MLVLVLGFAAGLQPAAAQIGTAPHITAQLSARSITAGDQTVLAYQILGGTQQSVEDFPREIVMPGLSISFSGTSRRSVVVNGAPASAMEVRYLVQPEHPGTYTIPEQIFRVDAQDVKSPEVTVEVKAGPTVADDMVPSAQITLGKTEMWKGEVIPVRVAVLVHPSVQPAGQFVAQVKNPGFAVHRFDRSAGADQRIINGELWRVWQVDSVMTALQPGVQTFGPALVEMDVFMPMAGASSARDPFGSMGGANRKSLKINSNTVEINVKDLPAEGKPPGFAGAVGNFELDVVPSSPTTLRVGEVLTVEIGIEGTGNFEAVTPPPLSSKEGWRTYEPRVAQENRGFGTEPGRRSYTQVLVPEKNLKEIPPYILTYFDPVQGTYVTKKSPAIPITVNGDPPAATASASGETKDFSGFPGMESPGEDLNDILSKPLTGGRWITTASVPVPANPWLLHGVPAALLALVLGSGIARRLRAAAAAKVSDTDAPRAPSVILADLRRSGQTRRGFHLLIREYLDAAHNGSVAPPGQSPEFDALVAANNRCLYGPITPETDAPVPDAERKSALSLLPPPTLESRGPGPRAGVGI